jgi:hypothetical protein
MEKGRRQMTGLLRLVATLSVGLLTPVALAQNPVMERARSAAASYGFDCRYSGQDAACASLFAAYDRALADPAADEAVRHLVLLEYLGARAGYGGELRQRGHTEDAAGVLKRGMDLMMAHLDGGRHVHTLIENQALQLEAALTLTALGRGADADRIIALAREAMDGLDNSRSRAASAGQRALLTLGYRQGFSLEREWAKALAGRAEDAWLDDSLEDDAQDARVADLMRQARTAYGRADLWLRRQSELGVGASWGAHQAEMYLELGDACNTLCSLDETRSALAQAVASSCRDLPDTDRRALDAALTNVLPASGDSDVCERAYFAWKVSTGAFDDEIDAAIGAMLDNIRGAKEGATLSDDGF